MTLSNRISTIGLSWVFISGVKKLKAAGHCKSSTAENDEWIKPAYCQNGSWYSTERKLIRFVWSQTLTTALVRQIHQILTFHRRKLIWRNRLSEPITLATTSTVSSIIRICFRAQARALTRLTQPLTDITFQRLSVKTWWLTPTTSWWYCMTATQNVTSRDATDEDRHSVSPANIIDWTSKWYWVKNPIRWHLMFWLFSIYSTCVSRCPPRSFPNQGGVCWACHESCETCGGAGQDSCLTCAPAHLYVIDLAVCLQTCPDGYFESKSNAFNWRTPVDKWWFHVNIAERDCSLFSTSTLSHLTIIFPCHQLHNAKQQQRQRHNDWEWNAERDKWFERIFFCIIRAITLIKMTTPDRWWLRRKRRKNDEWCVWISFPLDANTNEFYFVTKFHPRFFTSQGLKLFSPFFASFGVCENRKSFLFLRFCDLKGEMFLFTVIDCVPRESVSNTEQLELTTRGATLVCKTKKFLFKDLDAKENPNKKKKTLKGKLLPPCRFFLVDTIWKLFRWLWECFLSICLS